MNTEDHPMPCCAKVDKPSFNVWAYFCPSHGAIRVDVSGGTCDKPSSIEGLNFGPFDSPDEVAEYMHAAVDGFISALKESAWF